MRSSRGRDRVVMGAAALVAVAVVVWTVVIIGGGEDEATEVLGASEEPLVITPGPTEEPTPEPTEEPTPEPPPEPTEEPTPEPTDEATPETTEEEAPELTPERTEEEAPDLGEGELGEPLEVEAIEGEVVIGPESSFERELEVPVDLPADEPLTIEVVRRGVDGATVSLTLRFTDPDASGFVPGCPAVDWGDGPTIGCIQLACAPDPPIGPGPGVDQVIGYGYTYAEPGEYQIAVEANSVDPVLACNGYGGSAVETLTVVIEPS